MLRTLLLATTILSAGTAVAADRGFFGFALRTDFDGSFWNPVLAAAAIDKVVIGSPAARGGLLAGDLLLEFEGIAVPGAAGEELKKLKAILDKDTQAGDQRHMKLRRASGDIYSATLVAEPRKE